jgi:hypothetical protein
MIRDFSGISKKTLDAEIRALRSAIDDGTAPRYVSEESVAAIDSVRTVGNIGAHMEADVNHIVPVDADEAQLLIELVEDLLEDWYVERNRRQTRLKNIAAVAEEKKQARKILPSPEQGG